MPKKRIQAMPNESPAKKVQFELKVSEDSTPSRKRLSSHCASESPTRTCSSKWRSPRRCNSDREESEAGKGYGSPCNLAQSPRKNLFGNSHQKIKWNPRDPALMQAVKQALHVATSPAAVVCREEEQSSILEFCKSCIQQKRAGSLYVCGCPGTGKTLSIGKVQEYLMEWSKEVCIQSPDVLAINCTSLTSTTEIFSKILAKFQPSKTMASDISPLRQIQNVCSQKMQFPGRMMLVVADEMDYLVTKDLSVLHDLFSLTALPYSRFILIGIANAIDLTDRLLPQIESLNCKPVAITFRAYSKDQILQILQQRLKDIGDAVFQPAALEFCARKVAAASGDIRKALDICRMSIEVLEAELSGSMKNNESETVSFDHMDIAISKAYKSPTVDIIQSLPQHQQVILCTLVRLFRQCRKNATTFGELSRSYFEICKATQIRPVGMMEFANMCSALTDQGLIELGHPRDKLKKIKLKVDSSDITFALKGVRFFENCLE